MQPSERSTGREAVPASESADKAKDIASPEPADLTWSSCAVSESSGQPAKRMKPDNESVRHNTATTTDAAKEEMIKQLLAAKATAIFDPGSSEAAGMPAAGEEKLSVDGLMKFGYVELGMIIEWAKKVPGFRRLVVENQMALLKSSFMELNVLRLSYRSLGYPGRLHFAVGIVLSRTECTEMGWGLELVDSNLEFIGRLCEVNIDETEFSILNAIVLASPDAVGIVDRAAVTAFQNEMLECLNYYCATRHPSTPRRYSKLLLRLPALRMISARAADNFLNLSIQGQVQMNALVAEMMS